MLTFILKKKWFEKIERGEKTVEYREVKPYWTKRLFKGGWERVDNNGISGVGEIWNFQAAICSFRCGYTDLQMCAYIEGIAIVDGENTDLHINKPVYAIYFRLAGGKK